MATIKMRTHLAGTLRNAVDVIHELATSVRGDWKDDGYSDDPAGDANYCILCLKEIADHAEGCEVGKHSIADFADHYCLVHKKNGR